MWIDPISRHKIGDERSHGQALRVSAAFSCACAGQQGQISGVLRLMRSASTLASNV